MEVINYVRVTAPSESFIVKGEEKRKSLTVSVEELSKWEVPEKSEKLELKKLVASENMYLSDGHIAGKEIYCIESVVDTFHEITEEEYKALTKTE